MLQNRIHVKIRGYSNLFFQTIGVFFRNRFFLPLDNFRAGTYRDLCEHHGASIVKMFQGKEKALDPTFPKLSTVVQNFTLRDVPFTIHTHERSYQFMTRIIEGKELRLILFSFYGNQVVEGDGIQPWIPNNYKELSVGPLEVLRAISQTQQVDSLICHSLGNMTMEGLEEYPKDILPQTVIINRGLTSVEKVAKKLFGPLSYLASKGASLIGWNGNPERALYKHLEKVSEKKIVLIESKQDHFFSGSSAFDPNFVEKISQKGHRAFRGTFSIPYLPQVAHHSCRFDWILNNEDSRTNTEHFLPMGKNQSLSDCLAQELFSSGKHTCMIVGGSSDTLNSITYLQALPLLSSYAKNSL